MQGKQLWGVIYHIGEQPVSPSTPMHFAFFYVSGVDELRAKFAEFKAQRDEPVSLERMERYPRGFQIGETFLPPSITVE